MDEGALKVAVIAVHGVGHHNPREAARACADMLAATNNYEPFVESPLRIRVQPLRADPDETATASLPRSRVGAAIHKATQPMRGFLRQFDERPDFVRERDTPEDPSIRYMEEQLSRYVPHGGDIVYETVSLRAGSKPQAGRPETEVHVYDMYWTDLSRVSTAGLRMIGELYQLLFYVSGLGRHTLDFATHEYPGQLGWTLLAAFQRYAERLLVLWIPVLNLCAAGLVIVLLPKFLVEKGVPVVAIIAFFLAFFALAAWAAHWWRRPGPQWPHMFVTLVLAAMLLSLYGYMLAFATVMLESWLFSAALILILMHIYGKRRPGALQVGAICVAFITGVLGTFAVRSDSQDAYSEIGIRLGYWTYWLLHAAWTLFFVSVIAVSLVSAFLCKTTTKSLDRRTIWTANLSIAVPGLLVLILNLGLWQGGLNLANKYLTLDTETRDGIQDLINIGTPWSLGIIMTVGIVALLSTVWGMLPSVFGEVFPRDVGHKRVAFGESLSAEFKLLRFWGEVLRLFAVLLPVLYLIHDGWTEGWKHFSAQMTAYVGLALVAILFGPFAQLGMGLRTAIDVAIDVANWLRLHPKPQNPRAKICARFTSLLRNIVDYRGEDKKPFDRIVIFSHSQGTVISSELLRYLQKTGDPLSKSIAGIPTILFTMGCPLRQLYSQRFPIQYGWARDEQTPDSGHGATGRPDPAELNVRQWINAYRSGDYVGRELWADDSFSSLPVVFPDPMSGKPSRTDICIGAGGHTHYWDDSAMRVARLLDKAVRGQRCA